MALQSAFNGQGHIFGAFPNLPVMGLTFANVGPLDAVGERVGMIGYVYLSSGPGTSKVISSSGGMIYLRTGSTLTWADASTNLRVGIQDVAATGIEDTTFDVQADLVPGTDSLSINTVHKVQMESGTKTITHGDLIAVVCEMTARGGADAVMLSRGEGGAQPHCTANGSKVPGLPLVVIEFDDGSVGFFDIVGIPFNIETTTAFSSASTPDEHALIFRVPHPCAAVGLFARIANTAASDDFELILYSDPLGTPVAQRTIVQDMDLAAVSASVLNFSRPVSPYTLIANTDYAIAFRPTTANTLSYQRLTFGSGNGAIGKATMLGSNAYLATRSDQTGAFGSADTTLLPLFGVWLGQFDDGASGSSTEHAHVFAG